MFEAVKTSDIPESDESQLEPDRKIEKGVNGTRSVSSDKLSQISSYGPSGMRNKILRGLLPSDLCDEVLNICGENVAMYNWFFQVANSHDGPACISHLVNNKDVYGTDMIKLEQFVVVASFRGSSTLLELMKASEAYGDDYRVFMQFVEVARKTGPMQIHYLAEAKKVCNDEMFAVLCRVALERDAINKILFIIKTKQIYGDNMPLFNKMLMIASQNGFDTMHYFPKINAAMSSRKELLKVVTGIACDSTPKMPLP